MRALSVILSFLAVLAIPAQVEAEWNPLGLGTDSVVYSIINFEGRLIAGGAFKTAGESAARSIAAWNGTSWEPVGTGVGGVPEPRVFAMVAYDGALIVGGTFVEAGGDPAVNIARWDGTSWTPLGTGVNGTVYALTVFQEKLIAGGDFISAGGAIVNCIAQWDGSSWSGLGSGMACSYCGNDFSVLSLGVHHDNTLIAGGWFNFAGGVAANYIAAWTGSWAPLGSGMDYPVSAILDYGGDLIAGGAFSHAGGQVATGIARWNGTSWAPLGQGVVGWYNWVRSLAACNGALIAGGYFVQAGGQPANHVARWADGEWGTLDEGTNGSVAALAISGARLVAGGSFDMAGGGPAAHIAAWTDLPGGACCRQDGTCAITTEVECVAPGDYLGDETLCLPNPCPPAGACCQSDGSCAFILESSCQEPGIWQGAATNCSPNPCLSGACCFLAACEIYSPVDCVAHSGIYQGNGTLCAPDPCPTSAAEEGSGSISRLSLRAVPNPATGHVLIQYEIPAPTTVTLEVFGAGGELLQKVEDGIRPAGRYLVPLDALNSSGRPIPSGVYLAKLTTSAGTRVARVVVAR